jgi:spermidine synthase
MSSRAHASESELARLSCEAIAGRERPRVLVGGLGFGYTLRSALDHLPADAAVTVCEVFECVLEWNRGVLSGLAGQPLADRRVRAVHADVRAFFATAGLFDAILLDVDNGPEALALSSNERLYDRSGISRLRAALAPEGVLAVWSASPSPVFERRLAAARLDVTMAEVPARGAGSGPLHHLFLARRR